MIRGTAILVIALLLEASSFAAVCDSLCAGRFLADSPSCCAEHSHQKPSGPERQKAPEPSSNSHPGLRHLAEVAPPASIYAQIPVPLGWTDNVEAPGISASRMSALLLPAILDTSPPALARILRL
jgi:hypothetical protein